jgi:hypothetical protein
MLLFAVLLITSCGSISTRSQEEDVGEVYLQAGLQRPDHDREVAIEVVHRVISPHEIRGIIAFRKASAADIAVVGGCWDLGKGQYTFVVDRHNALVDPDHAWLYDVYQEACIRDHEVYLALFTLRTPGPQDLSEGEVLFAPPVTGFNTRYLYCSPTLAFSAKTQVQVIMDASHISASDRPKDRDWPGRLYHGTLCATSTVVTTSDDLVNHLHLTKDAILKDMP